MGPEPTGNMMYPEGDPPGMHTEHHLFELLCHSGLQVVTEREDDDR